MSLFSIDVESDAESPAVGSMISVGIVKVSDLSCSFYSTFAPITENYKSETLDFLKIRREDQLKYTDPETATQNMYEWVIKNNDGFPVAISDNIAFDWQWINFYFYKFGMDNPFGHSGRRIGDLYAGLTGRPSTEWKKFRKTKHTHNPVDDAMGNAEALIFLKEKFGLKI